MTCVCRCGVQNFVLVKREDWVNNHHYERPLTARIAERSDDGELVEVGDDSMVVLYAITTVVERRSEQFYSMCWPTSTIILMVVHAITHR